MQTVTKEAQAQGKTAPVEEELAIVNQRNGTSLTAEEVYFFPVRLCDNEVDRDFERFTGETLEELAGLFVGKSGIFDHQWSARGQTARIYRTEVVHEEGTLTQDGQPYCYLGLCLYDAHGGQRGTHRRD